jgi:hypothetical protein
MSGYFISDQQWWMVTQERQRQTDALNRIGEMCMFEILWSVRDFDAGTVGLCPTCNDNDPLIEAVYKSPAFERCPTCFSCRYAGPHGGIKAQLIRPTTWAFDEIQTDWQKRGEVERQSGTVTSTGDFRCQPRDYIFRGDGNRYQITSVEGLHLTTGFGTVSHGNTLVSVNYRVVLENPSSPAYTIPPVSSDTLQTVLNLMYMRQAPDFVDYEWIDGSVMF